MSENQGARQQLRSLGGRETNAKRNAASSLAKTCSAFLLYRCEEFARVIRRLGGGL
jgi:hypothetical protein